MIASAITKLRTRMEAVDSMLCVGLDSDVQRLPDRFRQHDHPQLAFNRWIIDQTHPFVCAYKPNLAFYEARGAAGWAELAETMAYLRSTEPRIFTIADGKRADIDSTNAAYVAGILDLLGFDAITLHPYLGREALRPFLERDDKAAIVLCRTSNPGAGELQDLELGGVPLWEVVATHVRDEWNERGNCMLVVGATSPDELARVRVLCPDMDLLVPGVGAQGGSLDAVVRAGADATGRGLSISASRSIIFADDPAVAAEAMVASIRMARSRGA